MSSMWSIGMCTHFVNRTVTTVLRQLRSHKKLPFSNDSILSIHAHGVRAQQQWTRVRAYMCGRMRRWRSDTLFLPSFSFVDSFSFFAFNSMKRISFAYRSDSIKSSENFHRFSVDDFQWNALHCLNKICVLFFFFEFQTFHLSKYSHYY